MSSEIAATNYGDENMNSSKADQIEPCIPDEVLCPLIDNKEEAIKEMLVKNYGLTVSKMKPLNGYDDLNYHVFFQDTHTNPHIESIAPGGYFLKVSNLPDSQRPQLLHAQRSVMDHLLKKQIITQEAIKGVNGDVFTPISSPNKSGEVVTYLVSLRNYLPGNILMGTKLTADFLFNLGAYVGQLTEALQDFVHPFYDTFDLLWSLNNLPKVKKVTYAVKDEKDKAICEEVLKLFDEEVIPKRSSFRKGQIHGDLNEANILVTAEASKDITPTVSGLLDFQDSARSHPVYDLAICTCYMLMLGDETVPATDIPGYMLAGYSTQSALNEPERQVFSLLIACRMVQSLVLGAYTYSMDTDNEYVLNTAKHGWKALRQIRAADQEQMSKRWDEIAATYKK